MLFLRLRRLATALLLAGGMALLAGGPAMSACFGPQQQLSTPVQTQFTTAPADIIKLSNGELVSKVRDLVASSPTNLPLVLGLLGTATPAQVSAIGAGLGQAAMICVRTDQAFAIEIQNAVATINNTSLTLAFSSVLGDQPIGAVGAAGGAGGGGGAASSGVDGQTGSSTGSGTGRFFGSTTIFSSFFTKNTGFNYFTSSSVSPVTTVTTVRSVSPTL